MSIAHADVGRVLTRWLPYRQANPGCRWRLFCFPHAGGSAAMFRSWGRAFGPSIEVCAIQAPGREERVGETAYGAIEPLVDAIVSSVAPLLDRPFICFGHSLGGLVASAFARQVGERCGSGPDLLAVSATRAPDRDDGEGPFADLSESELLDRLQRWGGTPDVLLRHPDLMRLLLPTLRADLRINDRYRHPAAPELRCPIVAFGGTEDASITREGLEAWRAHTSGPFRCRMFAGGHFFLTEHGDAFCAALREELDALVNGSLRTP